MAWCIYSYTVCIVNEPITKHSAEASDECVRSVGGRWVGRQRCKEPAWFSTLAQEREGKDFFELGNEHATSGLAFPELLRRHSSDPHPWALHNPLQRSGDSGAAEAELWLGQTVS